MKFRFTPPAAVLSALWLLMILAVLVIWIMFSISERASADQPPPPPLPPSGLVESLEPGWNLISSPVGAVAPDKLKGTCLFTSGPWEWIGNRYQLADLIEPPKGYWVKVNDSCTLEATGVHIVSKLKLRPGWNLISSSWSWQQLISPLLANLTGGRSCDILSGLWRYSYRLNQYLPVDLNQPLNPFRGYWVKVSDGCIVIGTGLNLEPEEDSLLPPGPPNIRSSDLLFRLFRFLGLRQALAVRGLPVATSVPVGIAAVIVRSFNGHLIELQVPQQDIDQVQLQVFDLRGRMVTDLKYPGTIVRWDGLSNDGRPLASGIYFYVATMRSYSGQVLTSGVRKLAIQR